MSEIIDSLKHSDLNQFQEELAKTYFSPNPSGDNHFTDLKPPAKDKKVRQIFLGIILGLLGIFIAGIIVFHRIEIDINVFPALRAASTDRGTEIIKDAIFYENSGAESSWGKDFILLSNEVGSKKAVLGIDFKRPLDMSANLLCFYVKGKDGGEDLRICLRDDKTNFCYSKVSQLGNSWQQFVIDIEKAKDLIDTKNIIHVDFEANPTERQNLYRSTIYFKDIHLIKREG